MGVPLLQQELVVAALDRQVAALDLVAALMVGVGVAGAVLVVIVVETAVAGAALAPAMAVVV